MDPRGRVSKPSRLPTALTEMSVGSRYAGGSNEQEPIENFVRNSNYSLVTVQMQYRLGPFGEIYSLDNFLLSLADIRACKVFWLERLFQRMER